MKFSGTNVLITGASRGIGAETAKVLADFGLKVWINYNTNEKKAIEVKNDILNSCPDSKVEIIKFDVSDESAYIEAFQKIITSDKKLDYLVNNAGITKDNLSLIMDVSDYDNVMKTNARSCFIGSKEAIKFMSRNRFGAVVNVSSVTAEMGNLGQTNYASSKGAIISMTKSFAYEGAPRNIRFNCITPGLIETDMTAELNENTSKKFLQKIPLKRFGQATDVAYAIAFLLSDYSKYITGEVMKVNGGMYM